MKIAFLLYPTQKVKVDEDSSFWMIWELQKRGHEVFCFESKDLFWQESAPHAFLTAAKLDLKKGYLPSPPLKHPADLSSLDCVFIRKEPPFNQDYLYALQLLEMIKAKVFVLNDPAGIALANEKTFILHFRGFCPESIVTEDAGLAKKFVKNLNARVVIKPLHEKGGLGIFCTSPRDKNLSSLLETATHAGNEKVLVQRFAPTGHFGDKRILILDGKILGAFARRPSTSDFRANLSRGGSMHKASVTPWDEKLVAAIEPKLRDYGLWFTGIDVIGKYLTEVNVTSPAGIPEINHFNKTHLEKEVADLIERKIF